MEFVKERAAKGVIQLTTAHDEKIDRLFRVLQESGAQSVVLTEAQCIAFSISYKSEFAYRGCLQIRKEKPVLILKPLFPGHISLELLHAMVQDWTAELRRRNLFAPSYFLLDGEIALQEVLPSGPLAETYLPFALLRMVRILQERFPPDRIPVE